MGFAPKVTLESDFKVRNLTLGLEETLGANPEKWVLHNKCPICTIINKILKTTKYLLLIL